MDLARERTRARRQVQRYLQHDAQRVLPCGPSHAAVAKTPETAALAAAATPKSQAAETATTETKATQIATFAPSPQAPPTLAAA